jgi:hypothetical protein
MVVDSTAFRSDISRLVDLKPHQRRALTRALPKFRRAFVAEVLIRIRRRKPLPWSDILRQIRYDPLSGLVFLPLAGSMMLEWTGGKLRGGRGEE